MTPINRSRAPSQTANHRTEAEHLDQLTRLSADFATPLATPFATQFAVLVEQHSRLVYRIAFSVTRHTQDAEDIAQEVFLELYRSQRWPQIGDHRAYLARMAWRIAIRRKRRAIPDELTNQQPSPGQSPETQAIQDQTKQWLHDQIDALPEKLRQPLALTALGELTSPEIAIILGIPEGTVRRRIHTARQLLKEKWESRKVKFS